MDATNKSIPAEKPKLAKAAKNQNWKGSALAVPGLVEAVSQSATLVQRRASTISDLQRSRGVAIVTTPSPARASNNVELTQAVAEQ